MYVGLVACDPKSIDEGRQPPELTRVERFLNAFAVLDWEEDWDILDDFTLEDFDPDAVGRSIFHLVADMNVPIWQTDRYIELCCNRLQAIIDGCYDSRHENKRAIIKLINLPWPGTCKSGELLDSLSKRASLMVTRLCRLYVDMSTLCEEYDCGYSVKDMGSYGHVPIASEFDRSAIEKFNYSQAYTNSNLITYLLTKYRYCKDPEMISRVMNCFWQLLNSSIYIDVFIPIRPLIPDHHVDVTTGEELDENNTKYFGLLDFMYQNGWNKVVSRDLIGWLKEEVIDYKDTREKISLTRSAPHHRSWRVLLNAYGDLGSDVEDSPKDIQEALNRMQHLIDAAWPIRMVKRAGRIELGRQKLQPLYDAMMDGISIPLQQAIWSMLHDYASELFGWLFLLSDNIPV